MAEKYEKKSKSTKLKIVIIIIVLILCLVGGALGAYFALKTDDGFEVNYKVKVAATVSGSYKLGEEEKSFGSITFDPKDKKQDAYQTLELGTIELSPHQTSLAFIYNFENKDKKDIKVTLVDRAVKSNIRVEYSVKQGQAQTAGNPTSGFIVAPGEVWSVEMNISVIDLERSATYHSSDNNILSWVLVGIGDE
ncbi:MAG: hypothetical protein IJZ62_05080 [Clostridia bacterium]|nr:hypothetical protein [Clostridia bacterium]